MGARHRGAGLLLDDLEDEIAARCSHVDPDARAGTRALEHLVTAEVHHSGDLGRGALDCADLDSCADAGAFRGGAQRCTEPAGLEQRRVDPLRELRRPVQGLLQLPADVVEERPGGDGIGAHEVARELDVDRERDEALLQTVVELALDAAPVRVGGDGEPPAGPA
jgi:hypothetical protein